MVSAENPAVRLSDRQAERAPGQGRLQPVDALRGAVMILMALDHVRDFISSAAMSFSPTDLTRTTTSLFLTRWITNICARIRVHRRDWFLPVVAAKPNDRAAFTISADSWSVAHAA